MGGEWSSRRLADVVEIISGGTPKTNVPEYWGGEIPWLSVADFNNGYRWVSSAEKNITERGLSESATRLLSKGDVIISARGTVGALAQLSRPMAFNQSCYGVRGKGGVSDTNFIYYFLRAAVAEMKQVVHGGVFDTITRDTFSLLELSLPLIEEQRAIAHILGTLDDKIELNRQQNKMLEEMARALFKAWFVDFEPVRAKMEGRWQPGQSLPGLPAHLYDLFPDRLIETEQGEIPQGWGVGKLADLCELKYGKALKAAERRKGEIPVYGSGGITGFHDKALVTNPTIIVGRKGTVGSLYWESGPCFPIDTVFYVDPKVSLTFCYHAMMLMRLHQLNTDAAVPGLNRDNAYRQTVIVPDAEMLQEWDSIALFVREKIDATDRQSRTLAQLRNTLLPKLISGELRVADTANFMENASSGFIERNNKRSES